MANKLCLGPLPKQQIVKMTIGVPVALKDDLERYAAAHTQLYGEEVDPVALIPHMLARFIRNDRGFRRVKY